LKIREKREENKMGKYCFGVDVGGTTVKLGLFNTSGDLMEKWEIPTVTEDDGKAILPDCAKSILKKMDERKMDRTEVVGVGIGAPGPVDSEGTLYGAVNLGWGTMSLKKELQTLLNMPVEAGNDANVAALGEAWQGGAKGYEDVVVVTLGTGVGGGIIINGKMVAGATGAAGEIGHMHVNDDETEPCNCGNCGCLEEYVSATGIVRMAKRKLAKDDRPSIMRKDDLSAKDVWDAVKAGDTVATEVAEDFGWYLGKAMALVANVSNPEIFVIGGGVSKAGNVLLDYFAVLPQYRGSGVGTAVLKELAAYYAPRKQSLIIECEHPAEAPEPAVARRRIGFYLRAGAHAAAMESRLFGVRYQIYSLPAGGLAKDEEIHRDLQELYRTMVPEPYYRGNVNFFGA